LLIITLLSFLFSLYCLKVLSIKDPLTFKSVSFTKLKLELAKLELVSKDIPKSKLLLILTSGICLAL